MNIKDITIANIFLLTCSIVTFLIAIFYEDLINIRMLLASGYFLILTAITWGEENIFD